MFQKPGTIKVWYLNAKIIKWCQFFCNSGSDKFIWGDFKNIWRRQWQPTPTHLPGKSHGWKSLVGCSPWSSWESDMTERLHFHFSLSCTGEGMTTHSSVLAWGILGTGEPGGLLSMGSHRVGHDWSGLAAAAARIFIFPWTVLRKHVAQIVLANKH